LIVLNDLLSDLTNAYLTLLQILSWKPVERRANNEGNISNFLETKVIRSKFLKLYGILSYAHETVSRKQRMAQNV